jgi:hypothetical protein
MAPAAPPSVEEPPPAPPVEPTAGVVAPEETPAPAPETAPPEAEQPEAAAAWREPPAPVETAQPAVEPAAPEPQPPPAPPEAEPSREPAPVVTLTTGSSAAAARDRYRPVVAVEAPPPPRRRRSSHILAKIGLGLATGLLIGTLIAWLTGGAPWSERTAADRALARIQILLTELHFEPGPADGVMRPQTAEAITQFQRFAGMPADGKPGSAVLAELEAVAAASRGTPR